MAAAQLPPTSAFAHDDGTAPQQLAAAIALPRPQERRAAVVAALRTDRVLVPVVARLDELQQGKAPDEIVGEKLAHTAMVTVALPDGRAGLPVFSSMATMAAWRADARPVPTQGRRAALAAAAEADGVLVLDPGGPGAVQVGRPAVRAVALGQEWIPAVHNPAVTDAAVRAIAGLPQVQEVRIVAGEVTEIVVELTLTHRLAKARVAAVVQELSQKLSQDEGIAQWVDSLTIKLRAGRSS
ncbi:MAG: SseB family protein [Beutenbergiaceae bacterium]